MEEGCRIVCYVKAFTLPKYKTGTVYSPFRMISTAVKHNRRVLGATMGPQVGFILNKRVALLI